MDSEVWVSRHQIYRAVAFFTADGPQRAALRAALALCAWERARLVEFIKHFRHSEFWGFAGWLSSASPGRILGKHTKSVKRVRPGLGQVSL